MSKKPSSKIDQARLHALAEIQYHESRLVALSYATSKMWRTSRADMSELKDAITRIQLEITQDINQAYSSYLMFSGLMGGEEERQAKILVMKRYLHDSAYVAGMLGYEGTYPPLDEELFRGELTAVREALLAEHPVSQAQEEGKP